MSDTFFPFAVQHIKVTYTYLDDTVASDSFSSGATNVSFTHTANSVSTIKAFYGLGTSVSPLSLIAPEDYVETTSGLTFHTPASKAGKVQYRYNAYTQVTETLDVTGLNLTLSHVPVSGYAITVTSEDNSTTYVSGTDYTINALNSRIVELIPGGSIVQRTNSNYYYTMNGDGSSQFGTGGGGGGVAAVPDTYYDENDLPESIFIEYDTVTPVEDETGNATTVGEITSYTVSAFASGIDFRLVSVDELIVDGRTLAINEFSFNEKTGVVTLRETPTSLAIQISYTWRRHYGLVSLSLDSAGTGNLTVPVSLVSTIKYPTVKTLETGGDTLLQYQDYVIEENLSSGIHKLVLLTDAIDGQVVVSEDGTAVYQTPVKLINKDEFNYDKLEDHHIVYRDGQLAISEEDPSRYVEYRDYDNEEYNSEWVERLTGSGTFVDPYLIYTPYDFKVKMSSFSSRDGLYFKLMNNLDFGPVLGYKVSSVNGEIIAEEVDTTAPAYSQYGMGPIWNDVGYIFFDGNNKILKNIYSYRYDNYTGSIFCNSDLGGRITNLTIYRSYKGITYDRSIGYIFNWTMRNTGLEIENVHIISSKIFKRSGESGNYNMIGAIGGSAVGTVRLIDCSVIDSEIEVGNNDAAALIGGTHDSNSVISLINCYSNSIVKSLTASNQTKNVSGLCNISKTSTSYIPNCHFENCYFGGQIIYNTLSEEGSGWPIVGGYNGSFSDYESIFVNCYSKSGSSKVQPYVTVKTDSEMKQPLFVNLLNTGLEEPAYVYNPGGYPKLLEEKIHPLSSNYRIPVLDSNGSVLYSTPYKLADLEKIPSISQAWKNHIEDELDNVFSPHALTYYTEDTLPNSIHCEYSTNTTATDVEYQANDVDYILIESFDDYRNYAFLKITANFTLVSIESIYDVEREETIDPSLYDFTSSGIITFKAHEDYLSDAFLLSYTYTTAYGTTVSITNESGLWVGPYIGNETHMFCYSPIPSRLEITNLQITDSNHNWDNNWRIDEDAGIMTIDTNTDSSLNSILVSYNAKCNYSVNIALTNGSGSLLVPSEGISTVDKFSCKSANNTVLHKYQDYYLNNNTLVLLIDKYQGQVPVTTEVSSAWINPSLVVKNPDNVTDLDDHPVVYKDSELVYRKDPYESLPEPNSYYTNHPFPSTINVDLQCIIDATESGVITTADSISTYTVTGYTKTNNRRVEWKLLNVSNLKVANQYVEYTFTEDGTITLNESVADGTSISLSYRYFWNIGAYNESVGSDGTVQLSPSNSNYMPSTINNIELYYVNCKDSYKPLIRDKDYTISNTNPRNLKLMTSYWAGQLKANNLIIQHEPEPYLDLKLYTLKELINRYSYTSDRSTNPNGRSVVYKNDQLTYSNESCNNPEPTAYAINDNKSSKLRFNLQYDLLANIVNESGRFSFTTGDSIVVTWYPKIYDQYGATIVKINGLYINGVDVLSDDTYTITIHNGRFIKITINGNFQNNSTIIGDLEVIIHYPKQSVALSSYVYCTPDPNSLDPDYSTFTKITVQTIFNTICTTMYGKLLEIDQDYTVTRNGSTNRFDINFVRQSLEGQILTRTKDGSTWLKPSLVVKNPDNITDLNNHPVVYEDGHLRYSNSQIVPATDTNLGLVQVGSNINVSNGEISVPTATASTKGVVAYNSNLFKTDTNDKLSLQNLFYRRSIRGVTSSITKSGGTATIRFNMSNPTGYKLLTLTARTNTSYTTHSWTQTTMQENYSSGAVELTIRNIDPSDNHTVHYIIDMIFIKSDLLYFEYNDTRT